LNIFSTVAANSYVNLAGVDGILETQILSKEIFIEA